MEFKIRSAVAQGFQIVGGLNGTTAYQYAVSKGYTGTEEEFAIEQAASANNSGRLAQLETVIPLKADLDPVAKTVLPAQIAPLQGLQTGVNCTTGYFKSTNAHILPEGDFCIAINFYVPPLSQGVNGGLCSTGNNTKEGIFLGIYVDNSLGLYLYGSRINLKLLSDSVNSAVIVVERLDNFFKVYINGKYINSYALPATTQSTQLALGWAPDWFNFKNTLYSCRVFNYALSDTECQTLWNYGDPINYMLSNELMSKCLAEYLPCGLLHDKWRDTSGNGNDIIAFGTPQLVYARQQSLTEIVIDTGVFYTNIAAGVASKLVKIPYGYLVSSVLVSSNNTNSLDSFKVSFDFGGGNIAYVGQILFFAHLKGNWYNIIPQSTFLPRVNQTDTAAITCVGNTTEGGMRVKLICKYIGQ